MERRLWNYTFIRDVSKTYSNGVQALKDVTLTIPVGMYGLLGPNGAAQCVPIGPIRPIAPVLTHKDATG